MTQFCFGTENVYLGGDSVWWGTLHHQQQGGALLLWGLLQRLRAEEEPGVRASRLQQDIQSNWQGTGTACSITAKRDISECKHFSCSDFMIHSYVSVVLGKYFFYIFLRIYHRRVILSLFILWCFVKCVRMIFSLQCCFIKDYNSTS